ncbi:MAG TPA: TonB family protein [Ideonella sp.]|uniref:energy transducer TonB n=1 Tax=Ideonella sp. TaxID=1929293 RepID=UPI002E2F33F9|nr:TonB family protein [Ideonella sp.]HEX5682472.1 TonB family protein [Ideonella sp.]
MTYLVRRLTSASGSVGLAALLLQPLLAVGQAVPPAPAASAADPSVSERVKKDAAGPLYWIRLNAQKTDPGPAKPAPRIVEVKPAVAAAPRSAPSPTAAQSASTVVANNAGSNAPASTGARLQAADTASSAPIEATAILVAPAPLSVGGSTASVAGSAGLAAPSGAAAATEAARAATVEEPDDQPLALVQAGEPEFPAIVMRRLRKGNVQVRFEVQPDGSVANATVVQTSNRNLNEAALEAVAAWRFQPVRTPRSAVVDLGFDLDG